LELVYLWVEDYKNIKKQGFNFSSRFEFKYDEESNELTIDENDDYLPDFFGENINITAIVGKNGSGKSSLLEFILDRLANRHNVYPKNFIFIYIYENKLYKYSNFKYTMISKIVLEKYVNSENLLQYYLNTIAININSEYKDFETRDAQQMFNENNKYEKNSSNLSILENYIYNKKQTSKIKENFFIPDTLKISIKSMGYFFSILYEDRDSYSDEDWNEITDLIKSLKNKLFKEYLEILEKIFQLKKEKHKNHKSYLFSFIENRKTPNYYFNAELLKDMPKIFQKYKINEQIPINSMNKEDLKYIKKLPYVFEFDLVDKNNINIDSLSFGEKQFLIQLHHILRYSLKKEYDLYHPPYIETDENGEEIGIYGGDENEEINIDSAFIFLDEFEIGLHPQWQKKTIHYIIDFLKELKDINFHIILTSHSPFLLSDIPKQNIIFLDKDENGNCKVVDGLNEKKQTFGANIHTLLSDSFFMEDGLMGEFAKSKIDRAIKLLNQEQLNEDELKYCEQIISIIGEPIVKNQLQRMLDSKRLKKVDEIDAIKKSMIAMKQRLDELEK